MKTLVIFLAFIITTAPQEWLTDIEAAKTVAQKENKLLLLNFSGSDWCAPCIKLKREVFESPDFKALAAEKLVLVHADFPRLKKNQLSKNLIESNEALAEKYNNSGKFPLTLLLDANGKIIKEWDGYVFASQDKFLNELKTAIEGK